MSEDGERLRDRRWVVVAEDGRYVTLGRDTDPTEGEIIQAEEALRAQGLAGWLAVMEGNPYVGGMPVLMQVRSLGEPRLDFNEGTAAFLEVVRRGRG